MTKGMFAKRSPSSNNWIGTRLRCFVLELKGEDVDFHDFGGTITEMTPGGQCYGIFGDDDELERYFKPEEIGQYITHMPDEEDDQLSMASVMIKTDQEYDLHEVLTSLKSALIGAWHEYKKKAEERAHEATIAIDSFSI